MCKKITNLRIEVKKMERTESFMKSFLTNRLGIVLATLNLCLLASRNFVRYAFSSPQDCFYLNNNMFFPLLYQTNLTEAFIILNLPAYVLAQIPTSFTIALLGKFCAVTELQIGIVFFAVFVALQWLFITWLAKTLARTV